MNSNNQLKLPGERHFDSPSADVLTRIMTLKPFVRQSGNDWRIPWFLKSRKLFDYLLVYIPTGKAIALT